MKCELCENPADHTIQKTTRDVSEPIPICGACLIDVIGLRDRVMRAGIRCNPALLELRHQELRGQR